MHRIKKQCSIYEFKWTDGDVKNGQFLFKKSFEAEIGLAYEWSLLGDWVLVRGVDDHFNFYMHNLETSQFKCFIFPDKQKNYLGHVRISLNTGCSEITRNFFT